MELIIDIYYEFNIILLSGEREKAKKEFNIRINN